MAIATCTSEVDMMIHEAAASGATHLRLGYDIVKPQQREVTVTAYEIATCTCELDTMIDKATAQFSWDTTL